MASRAINHTSYMTALLKMDDPFVSVVLPFYNSASYLAASINSIQGQSYQHFELILVDDGSQDDSREIALSFLSKRVSLISQSNEGVGGAFNRGIQMAQGRYIFLHSADDVAAEDRLQRSIDIFKRENVDMVTCRPALIDERDAPLEHATFTAFERACDISEPFAMLASLFFLGNFICAPAAAVSRRMIDLVGPVHAGLIQLQDFDYWLRAAALDLRFHIDPDPWLSYRRHAGNLSHKSNLPRVERETQLVYRRLAHLVTREAALHLLTVCAPTFLQLHLLHDAPDFILIPLVYLAHPTSAVRQIGYEMLMDLITLKEHALLLERYAALSPRHLFELVRADI